MYVNRKERKHRRYRIGKHLISTISYPQFYNDVREWGLKTNRDETTWTLDLYLGATIKVLIIRKNYYV